jgi:hypothetical protein
MCNTSDTMSDYSDDLESVCDDIRTKYTTIPRCNKSNCLKHYHVCAFFNMKAGVMVTSDNLLLNTVRYPMTIHAEVATINKVSKQIYGGSDPRPPKWFDVLVVRISPTGVLGSSRPCHHCIKTIANHPLVKVRYVYYSTAEGTIQREHIREMQVSDKNHVSAGWTFKMRGFKNRRRISPPKV